MAFVIAATLVVAALCASWLRTYLVRAQISASIEQSAPARHLVVAAFNQQGTPPKDAATAGIDDSARSLMVGAYVDSLDVHDGRLDLRFGATANGAIQGKVLSLTPFETADSEVVWLCGNELPDVGLKPLGFAGGGPQALQVATLIEHRYLPRQCR